MVFTSHEGGGRQLSLSVSKDAAMPLLETPQMAIDSFMAALEFGWHVYVWGTPSNAVPILDWVCAMAFDLITT